MTEQMLGYEKTRSSIVNSDQVVFGPHWVRRITSVEQDDLNAGTMEGRDNAIINYIFFVSEFERRKENTGDLLREVLVTKVLSLLLLLGSLAHGMAPKEGVRL